ncbi:MAG TPA: DUF1289 domain-containing protein [Rhizomicrobium sp.]|nr:DUF1289 domain-containing protein [Rhizomicrobium sp.]
MKRLGFLTKSGVNKDMESPCVKICTYDPVSGLCQGCGRTLEEITAWFSMSDQERRAVMEELPKRLQTIRTGPNP